jgi:hypothetical protein
MDWRPERGPTNVWSPVRTAWRRTVQSMGCLDPNRAATTWLKTSARGPLFHGQLEGGGQAAARSTVRAEASVRPLSSRQAYGPAGGDSSNIFESHERYEVCKGFTATFVVCCQKSPSLARRLGFARATLPRIESLLTKLHGLPLSVNPITHGSPPWPLFPRGRPGPPAHAPAPHRRPGFFLNRPVADTNRRLRVCAATAAGAAVPARTRPARSSGGGQRVARPAVRLPGSGAPHRSRARRQRSGYRPS